MLIGIDERAPTATSPCRPLGTACFRDRRDRRRRVSLARRFHKEYGYTKASQTQAVNHGSRFKQFGEGTMLKTLAVVVLAMGMSVGMAQARGHMHMQKPLSPCETERPAAASCACGPGKMTCQKGMWCHAFMSVCRP